VRSEDPIGRVPRAWLRWVARTGSARGGGAPRERVITGQPVRPRGGALGPTYLEARLNNVPGRHPAAQWHVVAHGITYREATDARGPSPPKARACLNDFREKRVAGMLVSLSAKEENESASNSPATRKARPAGPVPLPTAANGRLAAATMERTQGRTRFAIGI